MIGRGRLGTSLAEALGASLREGRAQDVPAIGENSIVFLACPDPVIPELAARLARAEPPRSAAFVHLSGAVGLEPLQALAERGHATAAFHPMQSFPRARPREAFEKSVITIQATTPELHDRLARLAETQLRSIPIRLEADGESRARYHAAAVMASNYLIALVDQAAQLLEGVGIPPERAIATLAPLMRGVIQNLEETGSIEQSLIGPIRRGDVATVRSQRQALEPNRLQVDIYVTLGRAALQLARRAGLEEERALLIDEALSD